MHREVARIVRAVALFGVIAWSVLVMPLPLTPANTASVSPARISAALSATPTALAAFTTTMTPTPAASGMSEAVALRGAVQEGLRLVPTAAPAGLSPIATVGAMSTSVPATAAPVAMIPGTLLPGMPRLVTWYGQPDSRALGILGEFDDPREMIGGLKAQAEAYTAADPMHPAIPTLELIASVASDTPGKDGLYLNPTRATLIEQYVQMAQDNNCLLLLDVQFGYDTIAHEIQRLMPYLKTGHVHLALDPEFHVKRGEVPGQTFGTLTAAEITSAQQTLAGLVTQYNLPDKVLVIHQFRSDMLPDKSAIKPVAHVRTTIMMDGFGGPGAKSGNYDKFVREEPLQYGGIKLFYKQDKPLMSPKDIVALSPAPLVVIYQ